MEPTSGTALRKMIPPSKAVAAGQISTPVTAAYRVPFGVVAKFFDKVAVSTKHAHKVQLLQTLFHKWGDSDMFPLIRLLLPGFDKERQAYGLKEVMLAKAYIKILGLSKESADAQRMLNWRKPTKSSGADREGGDFAYAVFKALENRHSGKGDLSVEDVNYFLDELNKATDKADKEHILRSILRHTTAAEHKWLVRIILRDLKVGLSEKTILGQYHEDAVDYFNVTSSLRLVCENLKDKSVRLSHENVTLFNPIKPMLANRHPPEKVVSIMGKHEFVIETKWDGERIQVHRDGNNIRIFSRKGNDVTDEYGEHIIPFIKSFVKINKCILDGELLLWDSNLEKWEAFGQHKTFTKDYRERAENNNQSVMNLRLKQRMELLRKVIPTQKDKYLEIVEQRQARTTQEVLDGLDAAIEARQEGIMVKNLDSVYVPAERKDKWIKLKPEYIDGVGDSLDMLILGGYYGSGVRKGGTISHFLVGVQIRPGVFASCCRVGSGYNDQELKDLQRHLQPHWKEYNPQNPPKCIELAGTWYKEKPDVVLTNLSQSRILQIKAAQITPTDKYRAGFTLRFPRVMKIRHDKGQGDCMTLKELVDLVANFEGRYAKRKIIDSANDDESAPKRRKVATTRRTAATALPVHMPVDPSKVELSGNLFNDMEFWVVVSGNQKRPLEELIIANGGSVTQSCTKHTYAAIANISTLKVKNIIQFGQLDVIHPKWIFDCIERGEIIDLEPRYMLYIKPETQAIFYNEIDIFGDSYTTESNADSLKDLINRMHRKIPHSGALDQKPGLVLKHEAATASLAATPSLSPPLNLVPSKSSSFDVHSSWEELPEHEDGWAPFGKTELAAAELGLFGAPPPWWSMFSAINAYLDRYDAINKPDSRKSLTILDADEHILKFYGGSVSEKITKYVTHVVVDPSDQARLRIISRGIDKLKREQPNLPISKCHIVSRSWVISCSEEHRLVDETEHSIAYS